MKMTIYFNFRAFGLILILQNYFIDSCPDNVKKEGMRCLGTYLHQLNVMKTAGYKFSTGLDAEELRLVCSSLRSELACVVETIRGCSDSVKQELDGMLSAHLPVDRLCNGVPYLYEDYAIHQHCFAKYKRHTERCYDKFNFWWLIEREQHHSRNAAIQVCNEITQLSQCVYQSLRVECGAKFELVDNLVRADVRPQTDCVTLEAELADKQKNRNENESKYESADRYKSQSRDTNMGVSIHANHLKLLTAAACLLFIELYIL